MRHHETILEIELGDVYDVPSTWEGLGSGTITRDNMRTDC